VNGAVTDGTSILSRIDRQVIDGDSKKSKSLAPVPEPMNPTGCDL
jgi:hypothetical protein